jgi:hypothetical protein
MRYTVAWSKIVSENAVLKSVILVSCALSFFFSFALLRLALKDPLVIDRACFSKPSVVADGKRTKEEIDSFLREALSQRFDSKTGSAKALLDSDELALREKEQKDMTARKLNQTVLFNSSVNSDGSTTVDADRVISVGEIRSAFRFPLKVRVVTTQRTIENPYGMVLAEVTPIQKGEK